MNSTVFESVEAADLAVGVERIALRPRAPDPRPVRVRVALVAFDLICTVILLSQMRGGGPVVLNPSAWGDVAVLASAVTVTMLALGAIGAYDLATRLPGARLRTGAHLALVGCAAAAGTGVVSAGLHGTVGGLRLLAVALGLPFAWICARVFVAVVDRRHPARVLLVGTGLTARYVWELSRRHPECGVEVIGFVDDDPLPLSPLAPETLGGLLELPRLVKEHDIERVIVGYTNAADADLLDILRALDGTVRVQVVPRLYELVHGGGLELGWLSLLEAGGASPFTGERRVKRAFDLVGALVLLVLAAPLIVVIAITIKLDRSGPILFRQRRIGRDGRLFEIFKFRTMADGTEHAADNIIEGLSIEDAVRELKHRSVAMHVTRVGRRLRTTSLDELPQLWNVVRGDMGLVGPRPIREFEADALSDWQMKTRHAVRPGITGLWQVSGRSTIAWEERMQLDCLYARHWSVTSDVRILARTVAVVVRGRDAV